MTQCTLVGFAFLVVCFPKDAILLGLEETQGGDCFRYLELLKLSEGFLSSHLQNQGSM